MIRFNIRAVQLDLARQMETLEFIREFIDFAAASGFNTLVLYLEGRVRTKTFPYPTADRSYSAEQMTSIIAYAKQHSIEIIPAVQSLAHAELFLCHEELRGLSELRETNLRGRWAAPVGKHDTFCPSLPETRKFLAAYLEEIAAVFPSQYLHVGLDEAWHIGICNVCRNRPEGQDGIFGEHIRWLHSVVTGKLGKRMLVWDDMLQHYPKALADMPRDIVLCCWHYDAVGDKMRWHFGDRLAIDKLKVFSELGFDCLICPAEALWCNPVTFTQYAEGRKCLGGLLTMWEKGSSFYHECLPTVGATGRLWSGHAAAEAFKSSSRDLFGIDDQLFLAVLQAFCEMGLAAWSSTPEAFLAGPLTEEHFRLKANTVLQQQLLHSFEARIHTPLGRLALQDILAKLEKRLIHAELSEIVPLFFKIEERAWNGGRERLDAAIVRLKTWRNERNSFWQNVRPGLIANALLTSIDSLAESLESLDKRKPSGLITLKLFLDNTAQDSEIMVKFQGRDDWEKILASRLVSAAPIYELSFPFPLHGKPAALRFETYGYGTQGIAYVKISNADGRFVPDALAEVVGNVIHPENVLRDSVHYALAGENYTRTNFNHHENYANKRRHGFEITLRPN